MSFQGKNKTFIALLLVMLLINPILVKMLHNHDDFHRQCHKDLAEGLNTAHHHHHEICEICSFEYVNVLPEDHHGLPVCFPEIREIPLPITEQGSSVSLIFASSRAPPVFI